MSKHFALTPTERETEDARRRLPPEIIEIIEALADMIADEDHENMLQEQATTGEPR